MNFVISNSVWDGKNLKAEFKQPFDIIAESKIRIESEITINMPKTTVFEKWCPMLDVIRTEYCKDVLILVSNIPEQIMNNIKLLLIKKLS